MTGSAWRREAPTANEVRACEWWWWRTQPYNSTMVVQLGIGSEGLPVWLCHPMPRDVDSMGGKWAPCTPPADANLGWLLGAALRWAK